MHFANSINFFSILTKVWDRRQVSSLISESFNCYEIDQLKKENFLFLPLWFSFSYVLYIWFYLSMVSYLCVTNLGFLFLIIFI